MHELRGSLDLYLTAGFIVSLQGETQETWAAKVLALAPEQMTLELTRPNPEPAFQKGEPVRVKYWDEGSAVYCWDTHVLEVSGSGNQQLSVRQKERVNIERRKSYRVVLSVPFSFTVIDAAEASLTGEKILDATTENLSAGGLAFVTPLALEVGDRLEISLHLPEAGQVSAEGWVVRVESESPKEGQNLVALKFVQLKAQEESQLVDFLKFQYK